jgi:membrane-associated HD superfamily phosphohydrolase
MSSSCCRERHSCMSYEVIYNTALSYKKQQPLTLRKHLSLLRFFCGVQVAHLFSFLCWGFHVVYLRSVSCSRYCLSLWVTLRISLMLLVLFSRQMLTDFNRFKLNVYIFTLNVIDRFSVSARVNL